MRTLTRQQLLRARLAAQLLLGRTAAGATHAVRALGAVQAQDPRASRLALRARVTGLEIGDVRAATERREVVRTWAMRRTLHALSARDVRWLVGLLGPVFIPLGRRRRDELGLDDAAAERALAGLVEVLRGAGPLTRAEVVRRLAVASVELDARSQAPAHLLGLAAYRGAVCRG